MNDNYKDESKENKIIFKSYNLVQYKEGERLPTINQDAKEYLLSLIDESNYQSEDIVIFSIILFAVMSLIGFSFFCEQAVRLAINVK